MQKSDEHQRSTEGVLLIPVLEHSLKSLSLRLGLQGDGQPTLSGGDQGRRRIERTRAKDDGRSRRRAKEA